MAIEQFGQSLLAGQRQRQRRIGKQQRRMQREEALGTLVGGIGNAYLKDKTDQFLNNEANQAFKMNYKRHLNAASNIIDEYAEAEKTQGGIRQYLINKRATFLQQDAESEWADKIGEYSQGDLNRYYQQEAAKWADANIDGFKNAYNSALEMGTMEDFQAAIARGYEGPANMADLVMKGVSGFFRGKNPANARSTVANQQRDDMLAAGKNIETYNAAINNGWDIDSAERLQAAVDNKLIKEKEREKVSTDHVFENINSFGKTYTVKRVKTVYREADGELVTESTLDDTDEPTALYLELLRGSDESGGIVTTGQPVVKDEGGYKSTTTPITVTDLLGRETTVYNVQIDMGEGEMGVASNVTDADRDVVREALTDQTIENLYINEKYQDATISMVAEAFANQLTVDKQQPGQEQRNKAMESLINSVAVDGRQFLNLFGPEEGQARLDAYNDYGADILRLATNASLVRMGSKMDLDNKTFVSGKGHTLNFNDPHSVALDFLASYVSLDSTESNQVTIPQSIFENMVNAVNTDTIVQTPDLA